MHLSLTPKLEKYVKTKVDNGLYNNASEVVREALRLMQEHEALRRLKRERLKKAIAEGEADFANGRYTDIKDDDDLTEFFARL